MKREEALLQDPCLCAAVILPEGHIIEGVNDSKSFRKRREALYNKIIDECVCYSIGTASEKEIDKINILQATFLAMKRAVDGLEIKPDLALVDGNRVPPLNTDVETIVKGDGKSASIAAASIIAKVARDRYMLKLAEQYPQYEFERHKGYPTKLHYEKIYEYGISDVHRISF